MPTLGSDAEIMLSLSMSIFKLDWNSSGRREGVVMFATGIGYIETGEAPQPCLEIIIFTMKNKCTSYYVQSDSTNKHGVKTQLDSTITLITSHQLPRLQNKSTAVRRQKQVNSMTNLAEN